jgi:hypothetical protein
LADDVPWRRCRLAADPYRMRLSNSGEYGIGQLQPLIDYFSPEKVERLSRDRFCFVSEVAGKIIGTGAVEGNDLPSRTSPASRELYLAHSEPSAPLKPCNLLKPYGILTSRDPSAGRIGGIRTSTLPLHRGEVLGLLATLFLISATCPAARRAKVSLARSSHRTPCRLDYRP